MRRARRSALIRRPAVLVAAQAVSDFPALQTTSRSFTGPSPALDKQTKVDPVAIGAVVQYCTCIVGSAPSHAFAHLFLLPLFLALAGSGVHGPLEARARRQAREAGGLSKPALITSNFLTPQPLRPPSRPASCHRFLSFVRLFTTLAACNFAFLAGETPSARLLCFSRASYIPRPTTQHRLPSPPRTAISTAADSNPLLLLGVHARYTLPPGRVCPPWLTILSPATSLNMPNRRYHRCRSIFNPTRI